jgi:hypothetical protein
MKLSTRTLPMLAGLALVGTAAGVSLGHSAISEINPLHYGSAPERFHADQVALRPDWAQPQPALAPAVSAEGLGSGCLGCSARDGAYYAAPAVVTYTDSWRADAQRAAAPIEATYVEEAAPDPERERVVRYASYPITEAEAAPAPADDEDLTAAEFETE